MASLIEAKLRVVRIGRRVDRAASHDAEKGVQRHVCQALEINRVQPVITGRALVGLWRYDSAPKRVLILQDLK